MTRPYPMNQIPYSLTISPPDRTLKYSLLKVMNPLRHVFLDDKLVIEQVFKQMKLKHYIVYPELDSRGRLHYHGTIYLNKTLLTRWYKFGKPKLSQIGYVDCAQTKNILDWHIYQRKEWPFTQGVLEIENPMTFISI